MQLFRATALLVSASIPFACKTADSAQPAAAVKDFDTGAAEGLEIRFDEDAYSFCANAQKFNVVNAYWLTLASAYVYATKDTLESVTAEIKKRGPSLSVEFIASPDGTNPLEPSTQALWIETDNAAILTFRGTPLDRIDVQDIVSDTKATLVAFDAAGNGKIHKGFNAALDSVWGKVEAQLKRAAATGKSVFVAGHSLGAALATLTTARVVLLDSLKDVRPSLKGLYTMGSPRVGDDQFISKLVAAYQSAPQFPVVRLRNGNDIVTRVPPTALGYKQHFGKVFFLSDDGRLYAEGEGAAMTRYKMSQLIQQNMVEASVPTAFEELREHVPTAYFAKVAGEYAQLKAWAKANNGDVCDDSSPFYQVPATPDLGAPAAVTRLDDLKALKNKDLEVLFARGTAELVPSAANPGATADGTGLPIILPGSVTVTNFAFNFWEGKRFTTDANGKTTLVNKLAGDWIQDVSAEVVRIPEGLSGDGKPSILLNYAASNRVAARAIRDEIRMVAPGIYLGRANLEQPVALWNILGRYRFVTWFALGF